MPDHRAVAVIDLALLAGRRVDHDACLGSFSPQGCECSELLPDRVEGPGVLASRNFGDELRGWDAALHRQHRVPAHDESEKKPVLR
jgi:hypothetical protein